MSLNKISSINIFTICAKQNRWKYSIVEK
jgi:hypothetical protein